MKLPPHILLIFLIPMLGLLPSRLVALEKEQTAAMLAEELLWMQISTAAKHVQPVHDAPAAVTVITAADIERYGYQTIAEALQSVRGFYISYDRNYIYLGTRGFGRPTDYNNRILLLINGHTINDNIYAAALLGSELGLDLGSVAQIEVVRGPGSALYGTNAMFAVINIITKKGAEVDGLDISAEAGSYRRWRGAGLFGKESSGGLDVLISGQMTDIKGQDLYFQEFDDPATNGGRAVDMDWDKSYGMLATAAAGPWSVQAMAASREKGVPTGAWGTNFNDDRDKTRDQRGFMELKYEARLRTNKNIMLRGYIDQFNFKAWYPFETLKVENSNGGWLGSEGQFLWDLSAKNRLTIGGEYQNHYRAEYLYRSEESIDFDGEFPSHLLSLYAQEEYRPFDQLSLVLGLRQDHYSTVGSATSPRAAVLYKLSSLSTGKLLYGEGFRAPNIYEAYYQEEDLQKFNPDLKPERIRTAELVWEQRLNARFWGTLSVYNYRVQDLIDWVLDPEDSLFFYDNISQVRATGVEVDLNGKINDAVQGFISYSFQDAQTIDPEEKLTNSPSHIITAGCSARLGKHLGVAVDGRYETQRRTVYGTETGSYALSNLSLSTRPLWDRVKLSLVVRNLFDTEYRLPGGYEHVQEAIVQDGRHVVLKITYHL